MVPVGYAFGSIDEMGDGVFRKVRRELGVTAFGVNVLVLAPGIVGRPHYHDEQDELYFVHRGRARFEVETLMERTLTVVKTRASLHQPQVREFGPGGVFHVESTTPRRFTSVGDEDLVMLVVGAKDGYVGRDGHLAEPGTY